MVSSGPTLKLGLPNSRLDVQVEIEAREHFKRGSQTKHLRFFFQVLVKLGEVGLKIVFIKGDPSKQMSSLEFHKIY